MNARNVVAGLEGYQKKILDLGCGIRRFPGAIGVDKLDLKKYHPKGKFIQCDINKSNLPFKDNTVDEVMAFHVLEHCHNLVHIIEEVWRVCKNGAKFKIEVPNQTSVWAWGDPTHVRCFNLNTFRFFVQNHYINGTAYNFKCDFDIEKLELTDVDFIQVEYRVVKPIRSNIHNKE